MQRLLLSCPRCVEATVTGSAHITCDVYATCDVYGHVCVYVSSLFGSRVGVTCDVYACDVYAPVDWWALPVTCMRECDATCPRCLEPDRLRTRDLLKFPDTVESLAKWTIPTRSRPEFRVLQTREYFTQMCSGCEAGSYLTLIDCCITQR